MNIAKETEGYIAGHPSIKDCVANGLINYSALSRQICNFLKTDKFDAVLIACRRYFWKIKKQEEHEEKIISLIKNMKIRVRNKILVAIIEKPRNMASLIGFQEKVKKEKGDFNIIEGESTITVITNSGYETELKEMFKNFIIQANKNLVQVSMVFEPEIETTSGVVNYVYGLLAENNINLWEEMSCWTDIMIIIDEKDLAKTMEVLSF